MTTLHDHLSKLYRCYISESNNKDITAWLFDHISECYQILDAYMDYEAMTQYSQMTRIEELYRLVHDRLRYTDVVSEPQLVWEIGFGSYLRKEQLHLYDNMIESLE